MCLVNPFPDPSYPQVEHFPVYQKKERTIEIRLIKHPLHQRKEISLVVAYTIAKTFR